MSVRKASVLELATAAYELEAGVLRGTLELNPEGNWLIDGVDIHEWLTQYKGHQVALILASMDEDRPLRAKVCRTCGAEYFGAQCPDCRRARQRLRGW
jgi:hypothetical protein